MANISLIRNNTDISTMVDDAISQVENGEVDALTAVVNLAKMRKALDAVEKDTRFRDAIMNEVDKYSERIIDFGDITIEKAEVGVKYDFSACNDSVWHELHKMLESVKFDISEREKLLKNIPEEGITQLDDMTGEVVTLHRPIKTSKSWIKITSKRVRK